MSVHKDCQCLQTNQPEKKKKEAKYLILISLIVHSYFICLFFLLLLLLLLLFYQCVFSPFTDLYQWSKGKIDMIVENLAKKDDAIQRSLELNKGDILSATNRNFQSMRSKIAGGLNQRVAIVIKKR